MTEGLDLLLRVAVALVSVLGLIWLAGRGWRRSPAGRSSAAGTVTLLGRQALGQRAQVAVVRVGSRALVLGVGEQRVELLAELPADEVTDPGAGATRRSPVVLTALPAPAAASSADLAPVPAALPVPALPGTDVRAAGDVRAGRLHGSALSPATWRQAVDVLRERSVRR